MINHAAHFVNTSTQKKCAFPYKFPLRPCNFGTVFALFRKLTEEKQSDRKDAPHGRATLYGINQISEFLSPAGSTGVTALSPCENAPPGSSPLLRSHTNLWIPLPRRVDGRHGDFSLWERAGPEAPMLRKHQRAIREEIPAASDLRVRQRSGFEMPRLQVRGIHQRLQIRRADRAGKLPLRCRLRTGRGGRVFHAAALRLRMRIAPAGRSIIGCFRVQRRAFPSPLLSWFANRDCTHSMPARATLSVCARNLTKRKSLALPYFAARMQPFAAQRFNSRTSATPASRSASISRARVSGVS